MNRCNIEESNLHLELAWLYRFQFSFQVWIRIQANTFKNWANVTLREAGGPGNIENLETDFQDGTKLVALVETLQKRKLKHNKKPINQHHEIENITIALDAIQEDGLKLVNIGKTSFYSHAKNSQFC